MIIWLFNRFFKKVIVYDFEKALKYQNGKYKGVLLAGKYRYNPRSTAITKYDIRPQLIAIPGQELLSSNGVALKISLAAKYKIIDPFVVANESENYQQSMYLILQLGLRDIICSETIENILENRKDLSVKLLETSKDEIQKIGIQLLSVEIKDIMFPGTLKQVYAKVSIAKQEGLAQLEKARGEIAALRNLANAAKLLENNPTLMQLRMIQALGESSGNTLILNTEGMSKITPTNKTK